MNVKLNISKYIESTKVGMDVLKRPTQDLSTDERKLVKECYTKLDEISETVQGVLDVQSPAAGEKYNSLIEKIHELRGHIARSGGHYNHQTVNRLQNMVDLAKEWSELPPYAPKLTDKIFKKAPELYELPENDILTYVVDGESIRQDIELFFKHCDSLAQKATAAVDQTLIEEVKALREQMKEKEQKELDVLAQYKNGEIDSAEAEGLLDIIADEKETLQFELDRRADMYSTNERVKLLRQLILKVEKPIRQIYSLVKDNRIHIYTIFNGVEFSDFLGMLNDTVSEEECQMGVNELKKALLANDAITAQGQANMESIEKQLQRADELFSAKTTIGVGKEKEPKVSRLDALLKKDAEKKTATGGSRLDELMRNQNESANKVKDAKDIF